VSTEAQLLQRGNQEGLARARTTCLKHAQGGRRVAIPVRTSWRASTQMLERGHRTLNR